MTFLDKEASQGEMDTGILVLNTQGVLVDVNEQYLVMTNLTKDDLLGKHISAIDPTSAKIILSKDTSTFGHLSLHTHTALWQRHYRRGLLFLSENTKH